MSDQPNDKTMPSSMPPTEEFDRLPASESDLLLAGESPAATVSGENGVSVKVFMSPAGSESCDGSCGSEIRPIMTDSSGSLGGEPEIWDKPWLAEPPLSESLLLVGSDAQGKLVVYLINPRLPSESAQAVAEQMFDTVSRSLSDIEIRARARAEVQELHPDWPICFWCEGPIAPGSEYEPIGDDRDDNPLPDKPLHDACARNYDPRVSGLASTLRLRQAAWEAEHER